MKGMKQITLSSALWVYSIHMDNACGRLSVTV